MTAREAAMTSMEEFRLRVEAKDRQEQKEWERLRWQEWHQTMLNPYIKQANRPKSPKALMRFPWEDEDEVKVKPEDCHISKEEEAALNRLFGINQ